MANKLFSILKSVFIFQDILSWLKISIPPVLEHNLGKYKAIKKAFYLTALEKLDGDYLEFGIFTGSSFVCAIRAHRKMKGIADVKTRFVGYDSFTGFGKVQDEDKHWFYLNDTFSINKNKVLKFIKKKAKKEKYRIVEGYFEKTLKNTNCVDAVGAKNIRIAFIDCDMKTPAQLCFSYIKPGLQEGTILIMDDFFSYKGSTEKGVAGAFYEFCSKNKNIQFRRLFEYGCLGSAFIVQKINR